MPVGMNAQLLLHGRCAHSTARHVWKRQLCSARHVSSVRCSAIREVQHSLRTKQQSASEVLEQYLHRLENTQDKYQSFLTQDATAARAQVKCVT